MFPLPEPLHPSDEYQGPDRSPAVSRWGKRPQESSEERQRGHQRKLPLRQSGSRWVGKYGYLWLPGPLGSHLPVNGTKYINQSAMTCCWQMLNERMSEWLSLANQNTHQYLVWRVSFRNCNKSLLGGCTPATLIPPRIWETHFEMHCVLCLCFQSPSIPKPLPAATPSHLPHRTRRSQSQHCPPSPPPSPVFCSKPKTRSRLP